MNAQLYQKVFFLMARSANFLSTILWTHILVDNVFMKINFTKQQKNKFSKKYHSLFRSSHPEVFCKKGVLRNFTKFIGKHLCQSLFFNKVAGLSLLFNTKYSLLSHSLLSHCFLFILMLLIKLLICISTAILNWTEFTIFELLTTKSILPW